MGQILSAKGLVELGRKASKGIENASVSSALAPMQRTELKWRLEGASWGSVLGQILSAKGSEGVGGRGEAKASKGIKSGSVSSALAPMLKTEGTI